MGHSQLYNEKFHGAVDTKSDNFPVFYSDLSREASLALERLHSPSEARRPIGVLAFFVLLSNRF